MSKTIYVSNFKGGVSKTSTAVGLSYCLAERGYKVLVIDIDPQSDASNVLLKTYAKKARVSIYKALANGLSVRECIVSLNDNLDLLPAHNNLIGFPILLDKLHDKSNRSETSKVLNNFIKEIKDDYDYIFIDTPPTISDFSSNAIFSCDYTLIVMQTEIRSFNAVKTFIEYLTEFAEFYSTDFDVIGILPVMFKSDGAIDKQVLIEAQQLYGDILFENCVYKRERVKRWDYTGITNEDYHDTKTIDMYNKIADELLEKIKNNER